MVDARSSDTSENQSDETVTEVGEEQQPVLEPAELAQPEAGEPEQLEDPEAVEPAEPAQPEVAKPAQPAEPE